VSRTTLASSGSLLWRAARAQWCNWGVAVVVASSAVVGAFPSSGWAKAPPEVSAASVALAQLPPQALDTHRLILSGGPFPYRKDGVVFGNRERLLPRKARGYYREYTVKTPGSRDRGARRIVCGGEPPSQPEVCYYTADHYATFSRIAK
jgi:ribonuclease T1